VFSVANGFAQHPGATVILLHVVTLNIAAPEKRVYEELGREARWYLERLARGCLRPGVATIIRVRFGKQAEEILAEAAASNADLIILPCYRPSFWHRLFAPIVPRVVEQVVRETPCRVFLASAQGRFNCEKSWGRPRNEIGAALDHRNAASESRTSRVLRTRDAWVSTRQQHHAAA
jgi:nucleotide-binding universal stress UspA family protein